LAASSTTPEPSRTPLPMTEKQLFRSVEQGRAITFDVFESEPIRGYLAGIDDERFFVLQPNPDGGFRKRFVSREGGGTPVFEIHDVSVDSYRTEPCHAEMERIIAPFRASIATNSRGRAHRRPSKHNRR
jgi:hypothetical protein